MSPGLFLRVKAKVRLLSLEDLQDSSVVHVVSLVGEDVEVSISSENVPAAHTVLRLQGGHLHLQLLGSAAFRDFLQTLKVVCLLFGVAEDLTVVCVFDEGVGEVGQCT